MLPRTGFGHTLYLNLLRVNRAYYTRGFTRDYNVGGVDIFHEDWDNLIILDSCRYDSLVKYDVLPGQLEKRESRGSATIEFLQGNFAGRILHDTVYVTGTPQVQRFEDSLQVEFYDVWNVWQASDNLWEASDGRKAVKPETLTQVAKKASSQFPNKRLIVHYTQPHVPFLDPPNEVLQTPGNPYRKWLKGEIEISEADLQTAYESNLELVLPTVMNLMKRVNGKTVITSDHGELLGEKIAPLPIKAWGHPHGIYVSELIEVPWLIHHEGARRDVVTDEPVNRNKKVEGETIDQRLRDLGYKT